MLLHEKSGHTSVCTFVFDESEIVGKLNGVEKT